MWRLCNEWHNIMNESLSIVILSSLCRIFRLVKQKFCCQLFWSAQKTPHVHIVLYMRAFYFFLVLCRFVPMFMAKSTDFSGSSMCDKAVAQLQYFAAYSRTQRQTQWIKKSIFTIKRLSVFDASQRQCYLLFYCERTSSTNSVNIMRLKRRLKHFSKNEIAAWMESKKENSKRKTWFSYTNIAREREERTFERVKFKVYALKGM